MRSNVPPLFECGDDDLRKELFSSVYWWRCLAEFDDGRGRPEVFSSRASAGLTPRLRVVRELERLAVVAHESLDDLRHRLLTYKAGNFWFPAGGIPKQETDIPPVITILLLGCAGSGKSSLINLMYSVFGRSGFVPFAHTASPAGKDGRTQYLEEHDVLRSMRNGFCVFDSRGLDCDRVADGLVEVAEWMEDGVRHRQPWRGAALPEPTSASPSSTSAAAAAKRFVRRRVNCAMVVADLSELHRSLVSGDLRPLAATGELFHSASINSCCNENPMLVLTHGDELTAEERIETRVRVCGYLGVPETTGVYDVVCGNGHGLLVDEMDPVTAYALAEAVYRALLLADRGHPPKPNSKDWLIVVLSWAMCTLSAFFALLSTCCSKMAKASREQKFRQQ